MIETSQQFCIRTHNGIITMRSLRTGEHRTFRVWTQKDDATFLPGCRLVGMLTGSDNESDYRSFGQVVHDGQIRLWRKHADERFYQWVAMALMHPERVTEQVEFSFEGRCRRCDRLLTTPESVASGLGPTCREKGAWS